MTEPWWRVWQREWVVVYNSDEVGELGSQECEAVFGRRFAAEVTSDEWRIVPWSAAAPGKYPCSLELWLPVMKGEFRSEQLADDCRLDYRHTEIEQRGTDRDGWLWKRSRIMLRG